MEGSAAGSALSRVRDVPDNEKEEVEKGSEGEIGRVVKRPINTTEITKTLIPSPSFILEEEEGEGEGEEEEGSLLPSGLAENPSLSSFS